MIKDHNQKQDGGEKSTNLQAQNITVNNGISYRDAKEIATDVFKNNFLKLSQTACDKAEKLAMELIDDFLERIKNEKPTAIIAVESPAMQYALFSAQKEYAKTGDKELGDILVDLLVERAGKEERSLIQIVLDESLKVSSKLTKKQFDVLSIVFQLKYTQHRGINSLAKFQHYLKEQLVPFCDDLTNDHSCYQHLEYTNCTSNLTGLTIERHFGELYAGLFQKGYTEDELETSLGELIKLPELITTCQNDDSLFQINAMNNEILEDFCESNSVQLEDNNIIKRMYHSNRMAEQEILTKINAIHPSIAKLSKIWNEIMKQVNLTTVGIALGRANIKRKINIDIDLSIWIK